MKWENHCEFADVFQAKLNQAGTIFFEVSIGNPAETLKTDLVVWSARLISVDTDGMEIAANLKSFKAARLACECFHDRMTQNLRREFFKLQRSARKGRGK